MTRRNWLVFAAMLIAASALALSGCGGDDGGLSAEDMARIDTAEANAATAEAARMAAVADAADARAEAADAEAARMAAVADAADYKAKAMAAEAEAMMAKAAQTEAEEDRDAAEEAAANAEIARMAAVAAQGVAETARDAAMAAQSEAVAARLLAEQALEMANDRIAELEAAAMAGPGTTGTLEGVEGRAAAQRIEEGMEAAPLARETLDRAKIADRSAAGTTDIGDDIEFPADAMPGDSDYDEDEVRMVIPKDVSVADLEQSRLGTPAELSLEVEGGTGLTTADDSADMDAPMIAGFTGVALEKDGPGPITQMALVYSDAERSVRAWGDVYRYNAMLTAGVPAAATATTPEASRTHLLIAGQQTDVTDALNEDKVSLAHGLSAQTGVLMRSTTDGGVISGSYDGVDGQYVFATAGTLTLNGDGTLGSTGITIVAFRADDPETPLPDTDYLAFGVWTEVPDSPTLANPGRVRAFVSGNAEVFKRRHVDGLTGSASYSGGAVGHYATRAQGSHTAEMGRFTASAALTATFSGSQAPLLMGTIDSFMDEGGTEMAGWLVNLDGGGMITNRFDATNTAQSPDVPDPAVTDPAMFENDDIFVARPSTDGDIYGTTSGTTGSQAWEGIWDAWLFGNNLEAHPTGVAGRFIATSGSAQPMTTPEGLINLFADEGFAGVAGSFAGR